VRRGPATLPLGYRDSYCPQCFLSDIATQGSYIRRAWLDAWTITCSAHGCLLSGISNNGFNLSYLIIQM
jgi:hypothetical protein